MNVVKLHKKVTAEMPVTEDSLAVVFADEYANEARFEHHSGKWYLWNGHRWVKNETLVAMDWCRGLCRQFGALDTQLAKNLGKANTIRGVESLARVDRRLAITSAVFDRNPKLLATPDGTVDLNDGALRPADPRDYITKQTAVAPADGEPTRWLQFLDETTRSDKALIEFLQTVCGYCLTGSTVEDSIFFAFGKGGNGKTVFMNTIRGIMGDYAVTAPMETFINSKHDQHPTGLAMLQGARLVTAAETEEGRYWAEARIKQLTGGDPISARFMHRDFFTFVPIFKLFIAGNHKPVLRNVDDAAKRRFRLIPFVYKPENPDLELEDTLHGEWPQILQWMIEGCAQWDAEGIKLPEVVETASKDYFDDQDTMAQWIKECCDVPKEDEYVSSDDVKAQFWWCLSSILYGSWVGWCQRNGEDAGSGKRFSQDLVKRGYEKELCKGGKRFLRINTKPSETTDRKTGVWIDG